MTSISLIIPVFNEERYLARCLDAVASQTRSFDEVVAIDNNSTDRSLEVLAQYTQKIPTLRVISEPRQGVMWAAKAGFDTATGDLIARIDADTRLEADCAEALECFATAHPEVDAFAGCSYFYDVPLGSGREQALRNARNSRGTSISPARALFGSNCAIRSSAWDRARPSMRHAPGTHEDGDLFWALLEVGARIDALPSMVAAISPRRFYDSPADVVRYLLANAKTHAVHGQRKAQIITLVTLPLSLASTLLSGLICRVASRQSLRRVSPVT